MLQNNNSPATTVDKTLDSFKKNSMELFLQEEYGIDNVLRCEFVDLREDRPFEFDVTDVRGNIQLQLGRVRTHKEYQHRLNSVITQLKKFPLL